MIVGCIAGAAVLAHLPIGKSPTLRQAVVAANVPISGNPIHNLDEPITGWSWGCEGKNYTVAYYVDRESNPAYGDLRIARHDDGKSAWSEKSYSPGTEPIAGMKPGFVTEVFEDGYSVYVGLQPMKHAPEVMQFTRELEYRHSFFGTVLQGLKGGAILYSGCTMKVGTDEKVCRDGFLVFDPETGASRKLIPIDPHPPVLAQRIRDLTAAYKQCNSDWFVVHQFSKDPEEGPWQMVTEDYEPSIDGLVLGIDYTNAGFECPVTMPPERYAIYVFSHVTDSARTQYRELPATGKGELAQARLKSFLTKDSLAKLFGKPQTR